MDNIQYDEDKIETIVSEWRKRLRRGFLRMIIYGKFLETDKDHTLTGTDLMEYISEQTNKSWVPSPGSIYPILDEFIQNGILSQKMGSNKKNKEYYITELGRIIFRKISAEALIFKTMLSSHHNNNKKIFKKKYYALHKNDSVDNLKKRLESIEFERDIILDLLKSKNT